MKTEPGIIVMATGNPGKIREIAKLMAGLPFRIVPQSEYEVSEAVEDGADFVANSLIKAQHACSATGLPAIADDSGLAVDSLDGAPGIYSARYAGPDASDDENIDKLLNAMQGFDTPSRGAAFHCAATMVWPDDRPPLIAEGEWRGSILTARRGEGGFGYDPVFLDSLSGLSAAELTREEKNERSHRGKALQSLVAGLKKQLQ